jgi:hypothetical protein
MIVQKYQPNPLNTFLLRRLEHCPPHFAVVDFSLSTNEKRLSDWIWEHLAGRFFLGDSYISQGTGTDKRSVLSKRAGFEIPGEASYFALFLPELNKF